MNRILLEYDFVLFDLDGTLVEVQADWDRVRRDLLSSYQKIFPQVPTKKFKYTTSMINYYIKKVGNQARELTKEILHKYESQAPILVLGASKILSNLVEQGRRVGVVSNNLHETIVKSLEVFLSDTDSIRIVGFDDVMNSKPDPEGINLAIKNFRGPLKSVVLIGDKLSDYNAARRAGVSFLNVFNLTKGI